MTRWLVLGWLVGAFIVAEAERHARLLRNEFRMTNPYRYAGRAYDPAHPRMRRTYTGTIMFGTVPYRP